MEQDNADVTVIMLAKNSVYYGEPVNDPLFSAHAPMDYYTIWGSEQKGYLSDFPVSMIGCTQQYQFCFAHKGQSDYCTDLSGLPGRILVEDYPGASDVQLAALQLLVTSSLLFDISDAAQDVLQAKEMAGGTGYIPSLPEDQWEKEIKGWEAFVWAALQTAITDYAIGPAVREPSIADLVKKNLTSGEKQLCGAQKMKKSGGFV